MDSLANYGSDGDNSNNSDDTKMPCSRGSESIERRASDANYDPVQMDMSEESNNNNSSGDSESERAPSPPNDRRATGSRRDSSRHRSSPTDQRRSDHDSRHSSNSRDDHGSRRTERSDRGCRRSSRERSKSRRSSRDDRRYRGSDRARRDSRDSKKSSSRDEERKSSREEDRRGERKSSREEDRRGERKSSSSCKDDRCEERDRDSRYRDERRDHRDREKSEKRSEKSSERRDRDKRHSRDERTKERNREERTTRESKEKARTRSRSRSKERVPPPQPFRTMSYREEKGRNKLAQLEKLGIELKPPGGDPAVIPAIIGEPNYYNPLATATQGKYAEQIQKRKLLWANKSKQEEGKTTVAAASTANTWIGTTFTHDQDGKVTAKFKRLMGIKGDMPVAPQPGNKPDILKKQEEMFNNMEQQYEVARATTHTQRGVGLGYATGGYQFPR